MDVVEVGLGVVAGFGPWPVLVTMPQGKDEARRILGKCSRFIDTCTRSSPQGLLLAIIAALGGARGVLAWLCFEQVVYVSSRDLE